MMRKVYSLTLVLLALIGCGQYPPSDKLWEYEKTISLDGINPIGLAVTSDGIWLSDGDHNRVVLISDNGNIRDSIINLDRPMHIDAAGKVLYIPQYGNDQIIMHDGAKSELMQVKDSLDAPAGVSVFGDERAIADFYNQKVHYFNGSEWLSFGSEGKEDGQFYYPTDVQITEDKIWIADAYNHRVQVFDKSGTHLLTFGKEEKMNATTGIFVGATQVYVTDFENDRIVIYDHSGALIQIIDSRVDKPTDLMLHEDRLYVINYRKGEITVMN